MQFQEKPLQPAAECEVSPDLNGFCFSRKPQKQRERGQLNQTSPSLEGGRQDETERKTSARQTQADRFLESTLAFFSQGVGGGAQGGLLNHELPPSKGDKKDGTEMYSW